MMTTVWEELRGNDCDQLLGKSTNTSESSPGKTMPSVEEEMGGNNSGHSSDKSTTSSDKSTLTSVSVKLSDSPDSSPPTKRLRLADQPGIDLGGVGSLSMEDHLNYLATLDDYSDSETIPRVDVRTQIREDAEFALAHYKKEKGIDYEYIGVRAVFPFRFPSRYRGTHLNFFARLRGSESKEMVFFYAELNHVENKVYNCCILPVEHDSKPPYMIQHPSHVQCEECEQGWDAYEEDTDDESLTSEDEPPFFM